MKRLAHISDLHFGDADPNLVLALDEDLDQFEPDLLVVTGDLTRRARPHEFEQARGFLDGLPYARLVVPGNHDIAPAYRPLSRLFNPYGRYTSFFPQTLNSFFADDQMLVIGLNTVHPLRWTEGSVSPEQIEWIEQLVRRHPEKFHVLAAHHPLKHVSDLPLEGHATRGEALLRRLEQAGIDLVLTGNLPETHGAAGRPFGVSESILLAQASTATTVSPFWPLNAYNRITLGAANVHIELRAYREAGFGCISIGNYERRAGRWRPVVPETPGSFPAPSLFKQEPLLVQRR